MSTARYLAAFAALFATAAAAQTTVELPPFQSVELRGGGHVTLRYGEAPRVTLIKGSTDYTHLGVKDSGKLVIDACEGDCPSRYDLEVEIVAPKLAAVAISGGGHIESTAGFPQQAAIAAAVDGGGSVDIRNIPAESGTAAVNGGGAIHIRATAHLTAAVNGGGSIRYSGGAVATTAIEGGGSIKAETD